MALIVLEFEIFETEIEQVLNLRVQFQLEPKVMRENYDFSKMKGKKNPYTKYLKQPVTMRLDKDSIAYFKGLAEESGIPYQTLINLYLRDCASKERKLDMKWR